MSQLLGDEIEKNERLTHQHEANPSKNNARKLEISNGLIKKYTKTIGEVDRYPADKNGVLPLAAVYFFCYGSEVVAAIGGAKDEFRQFDGATALYWHMMKFARANGYKKFNFYGTFGIFDEKSPGYSIYLFKKGWGGEVVNTLGEFSLPIKPIQAKLYGLLRRIKNNT
jgi:alanine adding enzyme